MMFTWFNGSTLLLLILCPVVSILAVGIYNGRLANRYQEQRLRASTPEQTAIRWPAGTRLRLTEDLYPWHEGETVVLSLDWLTDSTCGRVAAGKGPLDYMIPLESVEVVR